jgi:hypothetical protein
MEVTVAKAKKLIEKEGLIEVSSTVVGSPKTRAKKIKIRPFVTDTANVSVKYGLTIPTVEYGSARVDVFLSVPCYIEEIGAVYKQVQNIVEKLIEKEADKITGEEED